MAARGKFNEVWIGDVVVNVSAGNVSRDVVIDSVLDMDAVVTRGRGGATQRISVEAYCECASFLERLDYVEKLYALLGREKATLTVSDGTGSRSWTACLLTEVRELESAGAYVRFECRFVR